MKRFVKKVLPLAMMAVLAGCQSLPSKPTSVLGVDKLGADEFVVQDVSTHDPSAKQTVQAGVKALLKTSFSYRTQAYIAPQDVADDELPVTACEDIHDKAYIALSKKATDAGLDISADDYIGEREALKTDFLACQASRAESSDEQAFEDELARLLAELSGQSVHEFHDEQLSAKRQKLFEAYYLKTSKLGMVGNYQPLKGVISALPSFEYQFGQASMMVNQPIYMDIKSGDIYVWADNLALVNATWLDKKLGNAWHNKWLRVPLNDGSLPDDFVKTLLKTYATAQGKAFDELMDESFGYVTPDDVLALHDGLDEKAKTHIQTTATIIRQTTTNDDKRQMTKTVAKELYDNMTQAYPVLLEKPVALDKKQETLTLDSLALMQSVFAKLKVQASDDIESDDIESDESELEIDGEPKTDNDLETALEANAEAEALASAESEAEVAEVAQTSDGDTVDVKAKAKTSDNETLDDEALDGEMSESETDDHAEASQAKTQDVYYGFDARGRLLWVYQQKQQALPESWLKEPVGLGLLTVLDGKVDDGIFARLPTSLATPTHANSVNVLQYSNTLFNSLKESDSIFLRSFFYYLTSAFASEDKEKQVDGEDKAEAESQAEISTDGDNVEK